MNNDLKLLAEKYNQILLEAKFCGKCGAALPTPTSKFCGKCGAPVTQNQQSLQIQGQQPQQGVDAIQQFKNQLDQMTKAHDEYVVKLKALGDDAKAKEDALMKQLASNQVDPQAAMAELKKMQSNYKAQLAELEKTKPVLQN